MPVLCEKPLAQDEDGDHRADVRGPPVGNAASALPTSGGSWPMYRTLRQLVRSGQFGPVRAVMSHNIENWQQTIAGTWRDDPQSNPGGFIGDAGSHKIDAVFFVTGLDADRRLRPLRHVRQPRRNYRFGLGPARRRRAADDGFHRPRPALQRDTRRSTARGGPDAAEQRNVGRTNGRAGAFAADGGRFATRLPAFWISCSTERRTSPRRNAPFRSTTSRRRSSSLRGGNAGRNRVTADSHVDHENSRGTAFRRLAGCC